MNKLISWVDVEHKELEDIITFYGISKEKEGYCLYKLTPISTDTLEIFNTKEEWFVNNRVFNKFSNSGVKLKYKDDEKVYGEYICFKSSEDFNDKHLEPLLKKFRHSREDLNKLTSLHDSESVKNLIEHKENEIEENAKEVNDKFKMFNKMLEVGI